MKTFLACSFAAMTLLTSPLALADFGEIDLIVRESIEADMNDYGKTVQLQTLEYLGNPVYGNSEIRVMSSVWAEQFQIAPYWGWHECETKIRIMSPGIYQDLGTTCTFQFN